MTDFYLCLCPSSLKCMPVGQHPTPFIDYYIEFQTKMPKCKNQINMVTKLTKLSPFQLHSATRNNLSKIINSCMQA